MAPTKSSRPYDANPAARARPGAHAAGDDRFATVERESHHHQVAKDLQHDADRGQPEKRGAVLGRYGRTEQQLAGTDRSAGQYHARPDQADPQPPARMRRFGKLTDMPRGQEAGRHGLLRHRLDAPLAAVPPCEEIGLESMHGDLQENANGAQPKRRSLPLGRSIYRGRVPAILRAELRFGKVLLTCHRAQRTCRQARRGSGKAGKKSDGSLV